MSDRPIVNDPSIPSFSAKPIEPEKAIANVNKAFSADKFGGEGAFIPSLARREKAAVNDIAEGAYNTVTGKGKVFGYDVGPILGSVAGGLQTLGGAFDVFTSPVGAGVEGVLNAVPKGWLRESDPKHIEMAKSDKSFMEMFFPGRKPESISNEEVTRTLNKFDGDVAQFTADLFGNPFKLINKAVKVTRESILGQEIQKVVSPATKSNDAKMAGALLSEMGSKLALDNERTKHTFDAFQKVVNTAPQEAKFAFMEAMESGPEAIAKAPLNKDFKQLAILMKAMFDERRLRVQSLGNGFLDNAVANYFPHLWKNPDQAIKAFTGGKGSISGNEKFLKDRLVDTIARGRAMGLELVTDNPMEIAAIRMREMDKFYNAHVMLDEAKRLGLVMPASEHIPDGFVGIQDKLFKRGKYMASEDVARVFNNYINTKYNNNNIFSSLRFVNNGLNQMQLALSPHHLFQITMDAWSTEMARGIELLLSGKPVAGLKALGETVAAPATYFKSGRDFRNALLNPSGATPEMLSMIEGFTKAGGRISMDPIYKNNPHNMYTAFKNGQLSKMVTENFTKSHNDPLISMMLGPIKTATQAAETVMYPLMEYFIPRVKLGAYYKMAGDWMLKHPEASVLEKQYGLARVWDSVENRFGEMAYDNLFWDNWLKQSAFLTMRAVGWNLGTLKELSVATQDTSRFLDKAVRSAKGNKMARPEFTNQMAFMISQVITTATLGGLLTYALTGKKPEKPVDYFYPKTGYNLQTGEDERLALPSFLKDTQEWLTDPEQTFKNKTSPLMQGTTQIFTNRDYRGGQIIADPEILEMLGLSKAQIAGTMATDTGRFIADFISPFGMRSFLQGVPNKPTTEKHGVGMKLLQTGLPQAPLMVTDPGRSHMYKLKESADAFKKRERNRARREQ